MRGSSEDLKAIEPQHFGLQKGLIQPARYRQMRSKHPHTLPKIKFVFIDKSVLTTLYKFMKDRRVLPKLLRPLDAAARLGVNPARLALWERSGKLKAIKTLGGHRRYLEAEIQKIYSKGK